MKGGTMANRYSILLHGRQHDKCFYQVIEVVASDVIRATEMASQEANDSDAVVVTVDESWMSYNQENLCDETISRIYGRSYYESEADVEHC
jgi:hypothetical protein